MKYRFVKSWNYTEIGNALTKLMGEPYVTPRVKGMYPFMHTVPPKPLPESACLADICHERATQLWKQHDALTVSFSGGTDSTLVVACLLNAKPKKKTLYYTNNCNKENLKEIEAYMTAFDSKGCIGVPVKDAPGLGHLIVTGNHADGILQGCIIDHPAVGNRVWEMTIEEMFAARTELPMHAVAEYVKTLKPFFDAMPVEYNAANAAWWIEFATLWDYDEYEPHFLLGYGEPGKDFVSFFATDEFQGWAQRDANLKCKNGWKSDYKEIIKSILGPMPYLKKDYSIFSVGALRDVLVINEDYTLVKQGHKFI